MQRSKRLPFLLAALLAIAATAREPHARLGTFGIQNGDLPLVAGSRVVLRRSGAPSRTSFELIGGGSLNGNVFTAPAVREPATSDVIASAQGAIASSTFTTVPPPDPRRALIAVAAYNDGIVLHDARTFARLGTFAIGGPPGDVAFTRDGTLLAPDTDGTTLARVTRDPWTPHWIDGVLLGNEVAADPSGGDAFITNRDVGGFGALTRVNAAGEKERVVTGVTAEGLVVDPRRNLVYAGNVNDASIAQVDARTMRVIRKIASVPRSFGIDLDRSGKRLFVVANISPDMRVGSGYVAAIDVQDGHSRIAARSEGMMFPIGVAADRQNRRLFVTDESANAVYVLSASTLRTVHPPLQTCRTPWRPRIFHGLLYVPCTASNAIDVFNTRTLRRVHGAPFATGGYPLSVAVWP